MEESLLMKYLDSKFEGQQRQISSICKKLDKLIEDNRNDHVQLYSRIGMLERSITELSQTTTAIKDHEQRIRALETFKNRIIGALVVIPAGVSTMVVKLKDLFSGGN